MAMILVRTATPALLQVLTAVRVRTRFSLTPVFWEVVAPCAVPAVVGRVGRIRSGEVAIGHGLLGGEFGAVVA